MRGETIDCRELVGMAKAKRAAGRNWRYVRDDLIYYIRGKGIDPCMTGQGSNYSFVLPNGQIFYHRENGEYGCSVPDDLRKAPEDKIVRKAIKRVSE